MSSQEQLAARAADLAERIVDEISASDHDWGAIERHAHSLVELLALPRETARAAGVTRTGSRS
ncbi:MAG TPA: hypothetical protein VGI24_08140 [Solirubrobacteraceae bacterium]|jgi:hypothetical protein